MRAYISAECKDRVQVDVQDFIPVVVGELVCGVSSLDAAAVEQNVDLVAVRDDFLDEGGYGFS